MVKAHPSVSLPDDVIRLLFSFCNGDTLLQASGVNKNWYQLASEENLWKQICHREISTSLNRSATQVQWSKFYLRHVIPARFFKAIQLKGQLSLEGSPLLFRYATDEHVLFTRMSHRPDPLKCILMVLTWPQPGQKPILLHEIELREHAILRGIEGRRCLVESVNQAGQGVLDIIDWHSQQVIASLTLNNSVDAYVMHQESIFLLDQQHGQLSECKLDNPQVLRPYERDTMLDRDSESRWQFLTDSLNLCLEAVQAIPACREMVAEAQHSLLNQPIDELFADIASVLREECMSSARGILAVEEDFIAAEASLGYLLLWDRHTRCLIKEATKIRLYNCMTAYFGNTLRIRLPFTYPAICGRTIASYELNTAGILILTINEYSAEDKALKERCKVVREQCVRWEENCFVKLAGQFLIVGYQNLSKMTIIEVLDANTGKALHLPMQFGFKIQNLITQGDLLIVEFHPSGHQDVSRKEAVMVDMTQGRLIHHFGRLSEETSPTERKLEEELQQIVLKGDKLAFFYNDNQLEFWAINKSLARFVR